MKTITFETKCYEDDYKYILNGNYLKKMIERCGVRFTSKQIIVNNVKNRALVESLVQKKVNEGVIDVFYFVEDYEKKVLEYFRITKDSFGKGYVYSISELTGIFCCNTDYLLHFSSDAFLGKESIKSNWIEEAIEIMDKNSEIIIANPVWNNYEFEAKNESNNKKIYDFYISQGCSDQCYLIPTEVFKKNIYNTDHPDGKRYPKYGGNLFEKRVDAYQRNYGYYRITNSKASYYHANFPKGCVKSILNYFVTKQLGFEFCTFFRKPNFFFRIKHKIKKHHIPRIKEIVCK